MNDPSRHYQAQKRYEKKQIDAGLRRKTIWVPEAAEQEFWDTIDRLRRAWRDRGLLPDPD